ncbi:uncharacterized protein TM35_000141450 [Trypanosoma theileri]|uniref:Uncharacterized protein n=1 Tax=Trypanosoma theileri TaxID=67003 RepID=A0A1X0NW52_9TRYP|nr:uncharacterized protein TM35_000141450 [Trypanosoma theileri]ORC88934.1 hypothetical protein TM35_000141450 [Trypanosoma theileri]
MESQKNAHRLNRIFRKPKTMVAPREWHEDGEEVGQHDGVLLSCLNTMTKELTEDEKKRAVANQDPPSAVEEELAKRAARFGLTVGAAVAAGGNNTNNNNDGLGSLADGEAMGKRMQRFGTVEPEPLVVDEETLKSREARFKTQEQQEMDEAMQARLARFGGAPAQVELKLSEADREAMLRRQNRFAA